MTITSLRVWSGDDTNRINDAKEAWIFSMSGDPARAVEVVDAARYVNAANRAYLLEEHVDRYVKDIFGLTSALTLCIVDPEFRPEIRFASSWSAPWPPGFIEEFLHRLDGLDIEVHLASPATPTRPTTSRRCCVRSQASAAPSSGWTGQRRRRHCRTSSKECSRVIAAFGSPAFRRRCPGWPWREGSAPTTSSRASGSGRPRAASCSGQRSRDDIGRSRLGVGAPWCGSGPWSPSLMVSAGSGSARGRVPLPTGWPSTRCDSVSSCGPSWTAFDIRMSKRRAGPRIGVRGPALPGVWLLGGEGSLEFGDAVEGPLPVSCKPLSVALAAGQAATAAPVVALVVPCSMPGTTRPGSVRMGLPIFISPSVDGRVDISILLGIGPNVVLPNTMPLRFQVERTATCSLRWAAWNQGPAIWQWPRGPTRFYE